MVHGNINEWRSSPIFKPKFHNVLPGFKQAVGLFAVYCVAEFIFDSVKPKDNTHH
ncbi:hypothetical protein SAMD00019534_122070, partial [Acytostelium subglobosum LB1]|uniref:hypothetical protein n=1 Tax=Acytostelium subglobosum LB1 TaxID=1410327 RepID=UPI0006451F44